MKSISRPHPEGITKKSILGDVIVMKNKSQPLGITLISILLSPLIGGLIGTVVGWTGIIPFRHAYFQDGLVFIWAIAWIAASIVYYVDKKDK